MMSDYGETRKPPTSTGPVRHIDEQVEVFRKLLLSQSRTLSKYSSELPYFVYKDKIVQQYTIDYLDDLNFRLKRLLIEIMEEDISGETIESTYCKECNNNNDPEYDEEEE